MPLTVETSPALATATGTDPAPVTGSFTPPDASLLVATVIASSSVAPAVSGGSLTWTRQIRDTTEGSAEIWTAPVVTGASMTVTVTTTGTNARAALKVDVVTGHQLSSPIGTTGTGVTATDDITITGYTSTGEGRGFCAAMDGFSSGSPTSTDVASPFHLTSGLPKTSGMAVRKASNTSGASEAVTFNFNAAGDASWSYAALEILAEPIPVRPRILAPTGAVHRSASW